MTCRADDILGMGVTRQANVTHIFGKDGKPVHDAVMSGDALAVCRTVREAREIYRGD